MDTHFLGAVRPERSPHPRPRLLASAVLGILMAASSALVMTAPASATAAATPAITTARVASYPLMAPRTYEERVQRWVNVKRRNHSLPGLAFAACPAGSAERWSSYLARNDEFYHQSMSSVLARCNAVYAGETLGRGAITPKRLVRMWMNSPGHRDVLLSPSSRRIGIGATPDAYGRWVVAANFVRF